MDYEIFNKKYEELDQKQLYQKQEKSAQLTAFKQCPCWLRFCKKSYGILSFRTLYLSLCFYEYLKTFPYTIKIFKTEEWMFYYVGLHLLDD